MRQPWVPRAPYLRGGLQNWYTTRLMFGFLKKKCRKPVVYTRQEHCISRRNIDPDALKVLYRLSDSGYTAYLVGGGVRHLLLGRTPKDFDVGTSALPNEVKRVFRNCFLIGRRFRLAHIRFGTKVIETATFRQNSQTVGEIIEHASEGPQEETTLEKELKDNIIQYIHDNLSNEVLCINDISDTFKL